MYLRISTLLCVGLLVGFTTATETTTRPSAGRRNDNRPYFDAGQIDIDVNNYELEGSGGGYSNLKKELEASGSGLGPDDEDSDDRDGIDLNATPPVRKVPEIESESPEKTVPDNKGAVDNGEVYIMNPKSEDRPTSFFAQPGILAAVIGGAVVGLLCAILVVMFIVYRMRKKDEGSYALDEPKRSPTGNTYAKGNNREFYA